MDSFLQDSTAFLDWFRRSEGTRVSDKIRIADMRASGAGRGVVATQDITADEELFALPKSLILHLETSRVKTWLSPELVRSENSWLPLIATVIYELVNADPSPWEPYLRLLPTTFDSLMFWSEEELAELKGSEVVNKVGKAATEVEWEESLMTPLSQHPEIRAYLINNHTHKKSDGQKQQELYRLAHRAASLIMAYAFDVLKEGNNDAQDSNSDEESSLVSDDEEDLTFKAMVPFADLLNADADKNNAKMFDEDNYLIMKATAPIQAGKEIFNDYGPLPRSDLLRMYGYVTPNYAQYDVVELRQADIMASAKNINQTLSDTQKKGIDALDELGLLEDGYLLQHLPVDNPKLTDAIPAELHMLLRALTCNLGNDTSTHEKTIIKGIKEGITIQESSLLAAICTKRLADYPTIVEEDAVLLHELEGYAAVANSVGANPSPYRLKMAIEVRKGEKEILHAVIDLCQKWITERTIEIKNELTGTKRKHQGEQGRATEKEKQKKRIKA